jgi:hypothetical protein
VVSTDHFRNEILLQFELASAQGQQRLILGSDKLNRAVTKLPVFDLWMIFCRNAMRAEMVTGDCLIFDDSKKTLLTIRYELPR